jgi:CubicO group peptidase (beta-lactamase class C family)
MTWTISWRRPVLRFSSSFKTTPFFEKMEGGINARAIDFPKFGRLFLNRGNWEGEQLIPEAWVLESTRMDSSIDYDRYYPDETIFTSGKGFYAYMWWGMQREGSEDDFAAHGHNGQFIYVSPHKNLIIVRNGEKTGIDAEDWMELFHQATSEIHE